MTPKPEWQNSRIGFIGAGNMAGSLIRGLLAKGLPSGQIWAADIDQDKLQKLEQDCGINTGKSSAVAAQVDVLILAVKPQVMSQACQEVRKSLDGKPLLLLSIAAGITLGNLQQWLGKDAALVRCMPNTPALVGRGATALFANPHVSAAQRECAENILASVGLCVWLESEAQIDAVTALSGSGPAYFFLLMECMQETAQSLGLDAATARQLVLQTALGAAELAQSGTIDVAELRRQVTSPGGTTERAIAEFESGGMRDLVQRALEAARKRSEELARDFGK